MICKVCGTEIADKALICYRCGTSTFEPTRPRRPVKPTRPSAVVTVIALIVLILAGLFMTTAAVGAVPHAIALVVLVLAAIVAALQLVLRRRR
jgi:lipopolysaccharide export LptBFGC system permease protein LptF